MLTLRDLVESALEGRDPRLLARCDVHKILAIFDGLCIFDLDTLAGNLATSFAELQTALQPAAAPAFLGLLAATMAKKVAAQEPLLGAPPSTPSTGLGSIGRGLLSHCTLHIYEHIWCCCCYVSMSITYPS